MELKTYLSSLGRGGPSKLAEELGVSMSFLSQMAAGTSSISPARCVVIENVTNGAVTRRDLRPADFHLIWPELDRRTKKVRPSLRKINDKKSNKVRAA